MNDVSLTVIAPAHDERENLDRLVHEVEAAGRRVVERLGGRFEFIVVDDGSGDGTLERLHELQLGRPWLLALRMADTPPGRGHGQSAAFHAGFRVAHGDLIATLDADLQNDPADLPAMLDRMRESGADMIQGDRSANRRDGRIRRIGSWVGRMARRGLLGDSIRDTGCSLRIMRREIALRLPLEFRGLHRFIPVTARQMGFTVVEMPVNHRPRHAGTSKYGLGVASRAIPGFIDCLAVRWMRARRRPVVAVPVEPAPPARVPVITTSAREHPAPAARSAASA
jgi:glycosyltransferase involved in cell wall biosynthesis